VLNRQIHREAIGLQLAHEPLIEISGKGARVFRDKRAFGKPGFFEQSNRMSNCFIPPQFCELQMVQLRYLAVQMSYPLPDTAVHRTTHFQGSVGRKTSQYERHMRKLRKEIRGLEAVLWKCKCLPTLRLMLTTESVGYVYNHETNRHEYRALTIDTHQDLEDLLLAFLNAANCKHIKTAAEEYTIFLVSTQREFQIVRIESYQEPIASWYNWRGYVIITEEDHSEMLKLFKIFLNTVNWPERLRGEAEEGR